MFVVFAVRSAFIAVWFVLLVVVLCLEWHLVYPWQGSVADHGPFCERDRASHLLRERSNALSDFAFLALGFALLCTAVEDTLRVGVGSGSPVSSSPLALRPHSQPANLIRRYPSLTALYGVANCVHACGTWLNHSCRCHVGHRLDLCGMWLVSFFCALHSVCRLLSLLMPSFCQTGGDGGGGEVKNVLPTFFYPVYLMAGWVFWLLSDVWYAHGSYDAIEPRIVIANIALVAVAETAYLVLTLQHNSRHRAAHAAGISSDRYSGRYDVLAVGALAIGVGALLGRLDATGVLCWPDSWLQFHALWHVLAAVCLGCLYLYYRWEEIPHAIDVAAVRKER